MSTFSIKRTGILLSLPKVHTWKYYPSTKNRGKVFSLRSRNRNFGVFLFKLSPSDTVTQIFMELGWKEEETPETENPYLILRGESSKYLEFTNKGKKAYGIEFYHSGEHFFYFVVMKEKDNRGDAVKKNILNGLETLPPILPLDKNSSSYNFSIGNDRIAKNHRDLHSPLPES